MHLTFDVLCYAVWLCHGAKLWGFTVSTGSCCNSGVHGPIDMKVLSVMMVCEWPQPCNNIDFGHSPLLWQLEMHRNRLFARTQIIGVRGCPGRRLSVVVLGPVQPCLQLYLFFSFYMKINCFFQGFNVFLNSWDLARSPSYQCNLCILVSFCAGGA